MKQIDPFSLPAEHRPVVQQEEQREHKLIPEHATRTLAKWDAYRATERARLSALEDQSVMHDDLVVGEVVASGPLLEDFKSRITEFPTPETLAAEPDASGGPGRTLARETWWERSLRIMKRVIFGD